MIYFQKVRWKNFLSFGNYWTEIDLTTHKMNLLVGTNGNGKSSLLDVIIFGLFGRPYRKINKPSLVNSINGKGLEVEVEFSITENKKSNHYCIRRGMKPNIFEVYINNQKENEKDNVRDQQKYLEENILKTNYRTFTQIVILGSAGYIPFMLLTSAQRREFIENLLDIDIFSTMNNVLKERNSILKQLKERIENKEKNLQTLIRKQHDLVEKLEEQKNNAESDIDNEIKIQQKRIDEQQKTIDKMEFEIEELNKVAEKYDMKTLKAKKQSLSSEMSESKSSINRIKKDVSFMNEHTQCPTCKQDISDDHKNKFLQESAEEMNQLQNFYDNKHDSLNEVQERLEQLEEIMSKYYEKTSKINAAKANQTNIEKEIERLEKKKSSISIEDIETEKESLEKYYFDKEKYQEQKSILFEKDELYKVAFDLLKDNGIKSRIISQYIPIINKLINQYLQEMDFHVAFTLDETFTERILSRYRDEFTYDNFSQGEKMRIDIALLMVWRNIAEMKNSIHTNILLMDEVFDSSLDESGIEDFLKILHGVSKNNNIFIISHKINALTSKFDRVISVDKHSDFSYISIEG